MKNCFIPILAAGLALVFAASSCGGQKQVVNSGKEEIILPFSTPEYKGDAEYFRATASGTSKNLEMARSIANMNARENLAGQVEAVIKSVAEKYAQQLDIADKTDFAQKMQVNTRMVINQKLTGATVKGEKLYQNTDGTYEFWVNIEMAKNQIANDLQAAISNDEKLALDFDQHLFMKTFNEEMAAYERENSLQ